MTETFDVSESGNVVASNLNFVAGQTIANLAVARLTVDGRLCVYSNAITHVVLDVTGYHKALQRHGTVEAQ